MSDLDKLFENAPEGAVAIRKTAQGKMFFENNKGEYYHGSWKSSFCDKWVIVATRPQPEQPERKTVEYAVEWSGEVWTDRECDAIAYNPTTESFGYYESRNGTNEKWYHACTREEFEACVAAKNAKSEPDPYEEVSEGLPYILVDGNGYEWERVSKSGSSATWRKRKPTITKAEAWDKLNDGGFYNAQYGLDQIRHDYNITN